MYGFRMEENIMMKKKLNKMFGRKFALFVVAMLVFTFNTMNCFADEVYEGVSLLAPMVQDDSLDSEMLPNSTSRPGSDKIWNIAKKGKYSFAGESYYQTLYTNYRFTGKNKYTVHVVNKSKEPLEVTARRILKVYTVVKVGRGATVNFNVSDIKKSTDFYLVFEGSGQKFSGYIK